MEKLVICRRFFRNPEGFGEAEEGFVEAEEKLEICGMQDTGKNTVLSES
jgi:hypothetical protein